MTIGYLPKQFQGSIHYLPVINSYYWVIDLYGIKINNVDQGREGNKGALIDTGTSYILLPDRRLSTLMADYI